MSTWCVLENEGCGNNSAGEVCEDCGGHVPFTCNICGKPLYSLREGVHEGCGEKAMPKKTGTVKAKTTGLLAGLQNVMPMANSFVDHLAANLAPHLMVMARAGSGKTTTLVEGLKAVKGQPSKFTPSKQQKAIWEAMCEGRKPRTICFVAFNKSIATELQARVPQGCDAMTMHSMGFKAVMKAYGRLEPNQWVVWDLVQELLNVTAEELRKRYSPVVQATNELVRLLKVNLLEPTEDNIDYVADYFEVEMNGGREKVMELVPQVMSRMADPRRQGKITFDDMIWLPVKNNLGMPKYDLLLVDEAQDLSPCQQALAMKAGDRLIMVGDDRQAIYGFAGADSKSMANMKTKLEKTARGCKELPLTFTRRCGKAIVSAANQYVEDFGAFETNPEGLIYEALFSVVKRDGAEVEVPWEQSYCSKVKPGDFILCRVNAPLVRECFRFLRRRIKATIQGRDIGQGLVKLVEKLCKPVKPCDRLASLLVEDLAEWLETEQEKERKKKYPNENKLIALQDKHDCLVCFASEGDKSKTAQDVISEIESLFTDDATGKAVRFSSIHKAKGLEAERVFFLRPFNGPCPHPMAKAEWELEQEQNLCYVAITRAIHELVFVY